MTGSSGKIRLYESSQCLIHLRLVRCLLSKSSDDGHLSKNSKNAAEEFTKMTGQKTSGKFRIFVTAFFVFGGAPCPLQRMNWTEVTFIGVPPVPCINMI
jgi:hypothetical protein